MDNETAAEKVILALITVAVIALGAWLAVKYGA